MTLAHDVERQDDGAAAAPAAITAELVHALVAELALRGYGEDIDWSENIKPPSDPEDFALETIYVICNSGMKHTVARKIFEKCRAALWAGEPVSAVFGHKGKVGAIERIWKDREKLFAEFNAAEDKLAFCRSIPWIGSITQYHLAKNVSVDVAKPDVHLARLAARENIDAHELCARLAGETGYRIATVDLILWRACAIGIVSSRTGQIHL